MPASHRRRNIIIAIILLLIIILLLLTRCLPQKPANPTHPADSQPASHTNQSVLPSTSQPAATSPIEILSLAILSAPADVSAGSAFSVAWTGPDNTGDYITIVPLNSPPEIYANYQNTSQGNPLELTAPIQPGEYELRYATGHTHTVLGHSPIRVLPVVASLDAPASVTLGTEFAVQWTGPNNSGDYITIVPAGSPDDLYKNFANTSAGSPLMLTAPPDTGDFELRYVTGQGHAILARRAIAVTMPDVSLTAPADAVAGTTIQVTWVGPNNSGGYITIVPLETPDGNYGNYTNTSNGSPLDLLMPIMVGDAELRYMTGQGGKVLARRPIKLLAATVTLSAQPEGAVNADISITWTGPDNPGDYITIVMKSVPDGQYGPYTLTSGGSPLTIKAPKTAGDAEIRYMTGQGGKVLARIPLRITSE